MKDFLTAIVIAIGVVAFCSIVIFIVTKPALDAETACTQKGGHLVRTYSTTVCAKLEVIK